MASFVGLDVSELETSICVLDENGTVVCEGKAASEPKAIADWLSRRDMKPDRVGLETGQLSPWLYQGLVDCGLPAICLDARHLHAVLKLSANKTDRKDAEGIARVVRSGWFKPAYVKSAQTHGIRGLLMTRAQSVRMRRDLENQLRGMFKPLGIRPGKGSKGSKGSFMHRTCSSGSALPAPVRIAAEALLDTHCALCTQIKKLQRQIEAMAANDPVTRRLMTIPGIGALTAVTFRTTIEDAGRFKSAAQAGPFLGLTPRHNQSGEMGWQGWISRRGDAMTRTLLYEAAHTMLSRVRKPDRLKNWAQAIAAKSGFKRARVALARKLAVTMIAMWRDGKNFEPEVRQAPSRTACNREALSDLADPDVIINHEIHLEASNVRAPRCGKDRVKNPPDV